MGKFLDSILKPIAEEFCGQELVKGTTDFLTKTKVCSENGLFSDSNLKCVAMDVCSLYPNIKIGVALEAVQYALEKTSNYSKQENDAIRRASLTKFYTPMMHWCLL